MNDQERFEAWAKAEPRKWYVEKDDRGFYLNPYIIVAWETWQAAVASERSRNE